MNNAESLLISINIVVIFCAYFVIYPKYCGANGYKIATYDLLLSGLVLLISGSLFWGSGETFSLIVFSVNWFWFTLLTYVLIEMPLMLWYSNKHKVWESFKLD